MIVTLTKADEWVQIKDKKLSNVLQEKQIFKTPAEKSRADHIYNSVAFHRVKKSESSELVTRFKNDISV